MSAKISIITAVHNALPMNRLFWKMLTENTTVPFELIVIDSASSDGSEKFYSELAKSYPVTYLRQERNLSYPAAQNIGIRAATTDYLCFLNNDIWLPKGWQDRFLEELDANPRLVLSPSGQEAQLFQKASDRLKTKWKLCWYGSEWLKTIFGWSDEKQLWKALRMMYGNLTKFKNPVSYPRGSSMVGIKGDTVIFHRKLWERYPDLWDERTNASDRHIYLKLAAIHKTNPEIPLPRVLLDVYGHHFLKYTRRTHRPSNYEGDKLPTYTAFWSEKEYRELWWGFYLPHTL